MTRIYVVCEGQTEESFIKFLQDQHFNRLHVYLHPTLIGKPGHKGGNLRFDCLCRDVRTLLCDRAAFCTSFFDYYGLPPDFPGKVEADARTLPKDKAHELCVKLHQALIEEIGEAARLRFFPYVQMYEFEALLFSDPPRLAQAIHAPHLAKPLQKIRDDFPTPESINDSSETAPSKRLIGLCPQYQKVLHGTLASRAIGLSQMRQKCQGFNGWLGQLEAFARSESL